MKPLLFAFTGAVTGAIVARSLQRGRLAERLAAATLETLLNAIDANDAVTGAHARRVAAYALILADAAGVDERECKEIERVALFHDVGKIHEALFDIIHDDQNLSDGEREAVATHPRRGADVLEPLGGFYPSLPAGVLSHHERWDGNGYPDRLAGTDIPLTSRVVAIADTFDAITASRRYHPGENVARALDAIREGRGTQFDPELADRFLDPAIVQRIEAAMAPARQRPKAPRRHNRRHEVGTGAPDVSFRWRDRLTSAASAKPAEAP